METKTVNIELWEVIHDEEYYIVCPDTNIGVAYSKDFAELMVTAVNACKAINPDSPINAANTIPELFKALEQICETSNIAAIYNIAKSAIKKATSK